MPFECPKCHGYLAISAHSPYITCEYCNLKLLRTDPIIQRQLEIDANLQERKAKIAEIEKKLGSAISSGDFTSQISCYRVLSQVTDDVHYSKMLQFWSILKGEQPVMQNYLASLSADDISEMKLILKTLPPDARVGNRPLATLAISKYLGIIDSQMNTELLEDGVSSEFDEVVSSNRGIPQRSDNSRLSEIVVSELSLGRSGGLSCVDSYRKVNTPAMLTIGYVLVAIMVLCFYLFLKLEMIYLILYAALGVLLNYITWGITRFFSRGDTLYSSSCTLSGGQKSKMLLYQDGLIFEHKNDTASSEFLMYSNIKSVSSEGALLIVNINNNSSLQIKLNDTNIDSIQRVCSYISSRSAYMRD